MLSAKQSAPSSPHSPSPIASLALLPWERQDVLPSTHRLSPHTGRSVCARRRGRSAAAGAAAGGLLAAGVVCACALVRLKWWHHCLHVGLVCPACAPMGGSEPVPLHRRRPVTIVFLDIRRARAAPPCRSFPLPMLAQLAPCCNCANSSSCPPAAPTACRSRRRTRGNGHGQGCHSGIVIVAPPGGGSSRRPLALAEGRDRGEQHGCRRRPAWGGPGIHAV